MVVKTWDKFRRWLAADLLYHERFEGWREAIEAVRVSLREYPHAGGDIEIMREVERLIRERGAG